MKNNMRGLNNKEVIISRNKHGSNKLTSKKKHTFLKLVIESLGDPIIKILLIALSIKVIFLFENSDIYETLGIVMAIFLASFISSMSEYGSEKAFEKLNEENSVVKVKVHRNNIKTIINIDEVVVGDIVYLESGDKIPADGEIIEGEIYVNESSLSGETKEKHKTIINNEVYMGSIVTEKNAIMKVTLIGDKTFYGKIASSIQESTIESPLKTRLRVLAKQISKIGYICALIVFISYLLNSLFIANNFNIDNIFEAKLLMPNLVYALALSVAVVVMAVPEGLPMMITLVLSSNMKRMLKKNVLVRKLVGIETSGSLNILFTDKTGTLTEGILTVCDIVDSSFNEYESISNIKDYKLYEIMYQSLVYNNSSFIVNNTYQGGNTTDRAILSFCKTNNKDKYKILSRVDFDSRLKYSSITTSYDENTTFIKGAYEKIIEKCTHYLNDKCESTVLIDKSKYKKYIEERTESGARVLALAMSKTEKLDNLTLVGFVFIKDHIRKNAYEGISTIKRSGIKVVMLTGDSKETACSVAKKLNIIENDSDIVLTSEEFNKLNDIEAIKILPSLKILSRSLPEDKNRLVLLAQEAGYIVGMTGDGVNDAPALKKADVGFAMGSGTEVAKETSDIVILDNNISSIAESILYGRTIFKSIRKFVIFQLSVNVCAVLLSIIGPFIGVLTPVTIIQMLWINMVMDTLAGLAFAFEPALNEYMEEPPKKRNEKIINKYMKNQIISNGLYSTIVCIWFLKSNFISSMYRTDLGDKYLMTAFFGLFIFLAIFNAFNSRTYRLNILSKLFRNKVFLSIILFIIIIQIILIYFGGELFRTTGLTIYEFEVMLIISLTIIPFDFIRKYILKKSNIQRGV